MENHFPSNILFLRKSKGLSQTQMAEILGKKKSIIGPYEKGEVEPGISILQSISNFFGISVSDLIGVDLAKGVHKKTTKHAHPSAHLSAHLNVREPLDSYTKQGTLIDHVVDTSGLRLVPVVDISAAAGDGYLNQELVDETQVLRLPATMVKSGYHLCIRVKGPSMAPTFQDGGYLVIRLLDRSEWLNLRNEYCYVVVDLEGKTYVKRLKNRFSGQNGGFIVCTSDNPDKTSHPNFNLHPNEIMHIWFVEWYFTAKMPNIHDQYYSRVSNLEDKVDQIMEQFEKFKKQLK